MAAAVNVLEPAGRAQACLREAQACLRLPAAEALEGAGAHLEQAIGQMERLARDLKSGTALSEGERAELLERLGQLRRETARTGALVEGAATLRLGWARLLYAAACGYTARGEPARPEVARRLSVEG